MIENIEEQKKFKRTSFNPKTEIIPVGFDTVFKKIFGSGDNNKYIRYLLKKILKIEPQNIKILNSERIGIKKKIQQ